jgi:hypothetical protein
MTKSKQKVAMNRCKYRLIAQRASLSSIFPQNGIN